jgi:hypothetical protein
LLSVFVLVVIGAAFWLLWQPFLRISRYDVYGGDPSLATYAENAMTGTYFLIIPRDSVFFYPAGSIRAAILADHPDIAAVSLFSEGLTGLSIKAILRVPIGRWCGLAYAPGAATCYLFDDNGYLYASATEAFASGTSTMLAEEPDGALNPFAVFDALTATTTDPIGATLAAATQFPAAFSFARQVGALGSPVVAVALMGEQADLYLTSGTYLEYVPGQEQSAYSALVSAKADYDLSDGSIEYLDLRFPGKIYLKKAGQ